MLRGDEGDTRVDQRLLGVQHVERGALSGLGFLADAVSAISDAVTCGLGGLHLRLCRQPVGPPFGNNVGAGLVAGLVENQALLGQAFPWTGRISEYRRRPDRSGPQAARSRMRRTTETVSGSAHRIAELRPENVTVGNRGAFGPP